MEKNNRKRNRKKKRVMNELFFAGYVYATPQNFLSSTNTQQKAWIKHQKKIIPHHLFISTLPLLTSQENLTVFCLYLNI